MKKTILFFVYFLLFNNIAFSGIDKYKNLNYLDVLSRDLKVMDASAISLARENKIPIVVCSINKKKNLTKVLKGEGSFTIISD